MHGLENKNSSNDCMVVWIKRKEKRKKKQQKSVDLMFFMKNKSKMIQ